jgi:hypothetical protein
MVYVAWTRSREDTIELPIDALALLVLEDYVAGNGWNWQNWMRGSEQHGTARDPEIGLALSEAWSWLMTHGLVVRDPSQSSSDAYQVSRLGRETLKYGVTRDRELDLELAAVVRQAGQFVVDGQKDGPARLVVELDDRVTAGHAHEPVAVPKGKAGKSRIGCPRSVRHTRSAGTLLASR